MKKETDNWHVRLFNKSIVKQTKLNALLKFLPPCEGKTCLDLGGDNGVISALLRNRGGDWHSGDLTDQAVELIRDVVHSNVFRTDGSTLPFPDSSFDLAVVIDFLEHIEQDGRCVEELARILKPGGALIVNVPHRMKGSPVRLLRNAVGLTDEQHGHLRPGYTPAGLKRLMGARFKITDIYTYSRFFTELLDIAVSKACVSAAPESRHGGTGLLITEERLKKMRRQFKLYSAVHPLMWCFSRLDALLLFTRGHRLLVRARKIGSPDQL